MAAATATSLLSRHRHRNSLPRRRRFRRTLQRTARATVKALPPAAGNPESRSVREVFCRHLDRLDSDLPPADRSFRPRQPASPPLEVSARGRPPVSSSLAPSSGATPVPHPRPRSPLEERVPPPPSPALARAAARGRRRGLLLSAPPDLVVADSRPAGLRPADEPSPMAAPPTASSAASPLLHRPRLRLRRSLRPPLRLPPTSSCTSSSCRPSVFQKSQFRCIASRPARRCVPIQIATAFDEDQGDFSLVHDDGDEAFGVVLYSSESEWSDEEVVLNPTGDVELPVMSKSRFEGAEGAITVAAHRLASIEKGYRKSRTQQGLMNNVGLIAFLAMLLLFVDWCSWRIVRLPLDSFYLTRPFLISAVLSALAGFLFAPIADSMKIHHFRRRGKPICPSYRKPTPGMGGLFFVPIGIFVARRHVGSNSNGAAIMTLIFAMVGLLDDISNLVMDRNRRIPQWIRFLVQIVAGIYFSIWLGSTNISTPYSTKFVVPLPPPLGLAFMGKIYLVLAAICSLSMGTGVTLVDGLDGLAGGVAALALTGLSVAALPICSELSVFGASMSGACTGFLFHNRYRASIVMGRVGSFALGGALATIAACSGMFIPLLIACSIFFLELLLVILQIPFHMAMKHFHGTNRYPLRILPSHYYLRLWGIKEPYIVAGAYIISCFLTVLAGYLGLVSA